MAVTQIAYEVEGWGIGELVVAEGRVVWHELPWPRADRTARGVAPLPKAPSQTPTHPGQGAGAVVSRKTSNGDRGFVTEVVAHPRRKLPLRETARVIAHHALVF